MTTTSKQSCNFEIILQLCQKRLSQSIYPEIIAAHNLTRRKLCYQVARIVKQNLESGRAMRIMSGQQEQLKGKGNTLKINPLAANDNLPAKEFLNGYIDRVLNTYLAEHQRVEALERGDDTAWQTLLDELVSKATYLIATRWQIPAHKVNHEAVELVQDTCATIYHKFFPCDVPFQAWAVKILHNCILQRYTRSRDLIDRRQAAITSLDRPILSKTEETNWLHETLTDASETGAFEQIEKQELLLQAIDQLRSSAQRKVIIFTYFEHLGDEKIANTLGKTKNAVQILRYRALQQLRTILERMKESGK